MIGAIPFQFTALPTPLEKHLLEMGLISSSAALEGGEQLDDSAQLRCARHRQDQVNQMRPHWPEFMDTWSAPSLHQAARTATHHQRQEIAQAWAECLAPAFVQAVEALSGRTASNLVFPWVQAASTRRHERLPLAPGALLEEWCAAIDPKDSEDEKAFWDRLTHRVRRHESQKDRARAQAQVEPVAALLMEEVNRYIAKEKKGLGALKVWRRRPVDWLEDLLARPTFVRSCAVVVAKHTRPWAGQLKGDQAFPALAVGLEECLVRKMNVRPNQVDAVERWLAASIEQALPHALLDPLATHQVARLVRESLHLDAHAQSLTPQPLLRPASR